MRHLTIIPDEFDPQPDVRWLTNPGGDSPILTEECVPCATGEHADDGTGQNCPCCGVYCPEVD